jgi:PIN domain nuclease of toxin-antitoxin system
MNYLLDTHTFMWVDSQPDKLSQKAVDIIQNRRNTLFLSIASIWEIQIKHQIGKLDLSMSLSDILIRQQLENKIQLLPILLPHILELDNLPLHHRDPFDRLLVAQARVEKTVLISADPSIIKYDVETVW